MRTLPVLPRTIITSIFILNNPLTRTPIMASTSLSLSAHWDAFIDGEVASGRYASASDVMRAALRELEEKGKRLEALRAHLAEGAAEAESDTLVQDFDIERIIADATA
jgi:antitoxin ParD1/3/4